MAVNDLVITPQQLSAVLLGNYYLKNIAADYSLYPSIYPTYLKFSQALTFKNFAVDAWVYYTNGFLSVGGDYTQNFSKGAFWSNGQATFLSIDAYIGGWKNQLAGGISLQTLLAESIGFGVSAFFSVSRDHHVSYEGTYPLDGKFAAIRGLHKVEIKDKLAIGGNATIAMNFSAAQIPVTVALGQAPILPARELFVPILI